MTFIVLKHINLIDEMGKKPNYNLCTEELLTILKNIHEKYATLINKNSEIYRACRHKTTFNHFLLSTDDTV